MASGGLLFLMLMLSSLLISTVSVSTSDDQNQQQEKSSKDKAKYIGKKSLEIIGKVLEASIPFMELIPVHGTLVKAVFSAIGLGVTEINKKINGDSIQALMNEFNNLNIKIDQYREEQKWEIWKQVYHKPERKINIAWSKFDIMLNSVKEENDDKEKVKYKEEFLKDYSEFETATKTLQELLKAKGTTFINPLGDQLAEHFKCHEKAIRQYTVLIYQLIYKGNTMNHFYYKLKGTLSQSKVNDAAQIAYDAASVMFQVHMKCIINSMEYIKKDVETLIDKTQTRSELAKNVCSSLAKDYNRYDWMVVAFMTKKSQRMFKSMDHHILTGFTEVTKGGISVAVARQVKGTYTKTDLVKQTIGRCIDISVPCHNVAKKLKDCTETMEGNRVSQTYTAVHAYLREAHDSHSTKEATDEDYEVNAYPGASSDQTPFIYEGKCKKYGVMSGKFVVLIKSDEEILKADLCSKLNCGGDQRGKCVRVKDIYLAMCECKPPYYGEQCEESLDDYKKELEEGLQVVD